MNVLLALDAAVNNTRIDPRHAARRLLADEPDFGELTPMIERLMPLMAFETEK